MVERVRYGQARDRVSQVDSFESCSFLEQVEHMAYANYRKKSRNPTENSDRPALSQQAPGFQFQTNPRIAAVTVFLL